MKRMSIHGLFVGFVAVSLVSWCGSPGVARAQVLSVPNPSFALGDDAPDGWHLSGGEGGFTEEAAVGSRAVYVVGEANSQASTVWYTDPLPFDADAVYRLTLQSRRMTGSGGSAIFGPEFCNRDLREVSSEWQRYTSYFVAPSTDAAGRLRLGQWNVGGAIAFDDVSLVRASPVYRHRDGVILGEGERIEDGRYVFHAPFMSESANHARPLQSHDCFFNQPRWVFSAGRQVTYCHQIGDLMQLSGELEATIGHYTGGELLIEASTDGNAWLEVGRIDAQRSFKTALSASLFPANEVMVRFTGAPSSDAPDTPTGLQLYGYSYEAVLEGGPDDFQGATRFMAEAESDDTVRVTFEDLGEAIPGGTNELRFHAVNLTREPVTITPHLRITAEDAADYMKTGAPMTLPPREDDSDSGAPVSAALSYDIPGTGDIVLTLGLGDTVAYRAETGFYLSCLYESGYGLTLPDSSDNVALWWATSGWKVSRTRPAPQERSAAIRIQAARNEREAAQFVLRPSEPLRGLRIQPQPLQSETGATLSAEAVEVLRVGYVSITQPTDYVGAAAAWPDPLPPLDGPIDLASDENQPFWVRISTAHDTQAGVYRGVIRLEADDWQAEAPLEVEVFDFALPDRKTCVTAFGFDAPLAFRYHNVESEAHRRLVYDQYLSLLSEHHISIYDPAFLDPIEYDWPKLSQWRGGEYDRQEVRDAGASLLLRDTSETDNVSAWYDKLLPVPEGGLHLAFYYKTGEPGHAFTVTLLHYDVSGVWLRGKNNDIVIEGDGAWQRFETVIDVFPEGARQFRPRLWATLHTEEGVHTGSVWFDNVELRDVAEDAILVQDDFTPHDPDDVAELFIPEFDWEAWDAAMTRAFDHYHFNSFRLRVPGLGGGTFHRRWEPNLLGYDEDTPEYQTAFNAWCRAAEAHLRARGWLDKAYVYWFDEPTPDDYEFVMNGFRKLKAAAPGLNRMLTEEVAPELFGGPNIWCPVTYNYDHDMAEQRRAVGEKIWWYVCTGPKAPYATLFIDHPGTALRVWLWQTWERDIDGILIWQTNYWTSDEAYPDAPQNPYEDPMSWVTSYGTPIGTRRPWGNGDGRFVYPPLAAADGQPDAPVFDAPVGSIRLDMLRDGIEDYEYFVILRGLLESLEGEHAESELAPYRRLLEVPDAVTTSMTEFTWNPAPIETHREAIARAIMRLKARQASN